MGRRYHLGNSYLYRDKTDGRCHFDHYRCRPGARDWAFSILPKGLVALSAGLGAAASNVCAGFVV
jgi:hypothetical protein